MVESHGLTPHRPLMQNGYFLTGSWKCKNPPSSTNRNQTAEYILRYIPKSILMKAIPRHIQQTHSTVMSMCNSPPQLNHGFWRVFDIKGKQVFHPASYMQVYLQIYHPKTQELAGLLSKAQVPGMRWQGGLRCFRHLVSMDSIVARHPRHLEMFCPGLDDPRDIWEVNFLYKHTYVLAFQKLLLDVLKHSKASWLDDFIWHCQLIHFFLLESHSTFWDQRPSDTGLRSGHRRFFIASSTSKCQ